MRRACASLGPRDAVLGALRALAGLDELREEPPADGVVTVVARSLAGR